MKFHRLAGNFTAIALTTTLGLTLVAPNTVLAADNTEPTAIASARLSPAAAIDPVDNFQRVSSGLWRGAAPDQAGLKELAQRGVKTVIDLRLDGTGTDQEAKQCQQLGVHYYHFPLGFTAPSDEKIKTILSIALDPEKQPVFLHCRQGADRTGTIVGLYRRLVLGWSFEQTYEEMRAHHFKPWLVSLKNLVKEARPEDLPDVTPQARQHGPAVAHLDNSIQ